jgi:hypothetical protein
MIEDATKGELSLPIAVPRNAHDLMLYKKGKAKLRDVDRVEPHFLGTIESPEYESFADAMDDGSNVEGSMRSDDQEIARMVRTQAQKAGDTVVSNWPLDRTRRALGAVMRRYSLNMMRANAVERAKAKANG